MLTSDNEGGLLFLMVAIVIKQNLKSSLLQGRLMDLLVD